MHNALGLLQLQPALPSSPPLPLARPCPPLKVTAVYRSSSSSSEEEEGGAASAAAAGGGEDLAALSDADIEAMDAASLRRLLLGRGLPASGKISKLRERLREARDA